MSMFVTGPWLRSARFDGGLLVPGRPRRRTFDLLLTPEHAVIRGSGELVLPWSEHLDFIRCVTSSHGWCVGSWGMREAGVAVDLQGPLYEQSRALPLMQTWLTRSATTPFGGGRAPLHLQTPFGRQSDKDVLHALCTTFALRADLRERLNSAGTVTDLLARIVSTPHARGYELGGVRRLTIETDSALRALDCIHQIGGRPLPDDVIPSADDLLPQVLEHIHASRYARETTVDKVEVHALIHRGYSRWAPWPFEPLFA